MRFLILGVDEGFGRSKPGYTDTIILVSITSPRRKPIMMSIPRDLWISIAGQEENRICVLYTIAETKENGRGPYAVTAAVSKSFQIPVHHYVLIKMQGLIDLVDSLGGVDVAFSQPLGRYPIRFTHLDGRAALAFVRDRDETDDFARMGQAQLLINAMLERVFTFKTWIKLPRTLNTLKKVVETNISIWKWPWLTFLMLISCINGLEGHTITRAMVYPRITPQGEQVIEPNWKKIRSLTDLLLSKDGIDDV